MMSRAAPTLQDELDLLIDRARRAGALAQHLKAQGLNISYKSDGSIVTNADLEVDLWLKEALLDARPGYAWQSEESPDTPARLTQSHLFVLDPIDGTMGFTKGSPYWTIALCLVQARQPVAAVVYAPDAQEMYSAGKGLGAFLNGEPIGASATTDLSVAQGIGDARLFGRDIWPEPWPKMSITSRPSVAYRMVCVAAGRADFTLALTPKRDWDVAAATLICHEAGATVSDHLGQAYDFNAPDSLKASLICANSGLYPEIRRRCAALPSLETL
ncbi:inositol monophosphatase family protein [Asticcacaulis excentricus]|uniref:Inositol monophosphatase n=1 Tax=Asticcacaulis excentricus (strain ATCC 15261 / DSM 4724 / KCTC 12464 / NCIMB 9791 / VKM B-1370 / CB 48) TaxID=573065 RepID=E8RUM5_ASTEC|nr:3'(2'),5'-bisphosphate nucleotidase CysQ [Asticcacaulis excentricus]ADU15150.1 inositol monophosphatase [Asticcacaulis excentricus CB 48]